MAVCDVIQLLDGLYDEILRARLGSDEDFLKALGRLGNSLEATRHRALDSKGSGPATGAKGFTAIRSANNHPDHALDRLDPAEDFVTLLGCAPMTAA